MAFKNALDVNNHRINLYTYIICKGRNLHCDVVHITTVWVFRIVLDHEIAAIQTSR